MGGGDGQGLAHLALVIRWNLTDKGRNDLVNVAAVILLELQSRDGRLEVSDTLQLRENSMRLEDVGSGLAGLVISPCCFVA